MAHSEAEARGQAEARAAVLAEYEAEGRADEAENVFASTLYEHAFTGPSLGTEEELSGATIKMKMTAARLIGVVSRGDEPLVLITRDMRIQAFEDDYREYTIELRTTPTLVPGPGTPVTHWEHRRRALQVAIWAIEVHTTTPLTSDSWGGYDTYIRNPDHSFIKSSSTGITGTDKQATFGIPADAIVSAGQGDRTTEQLHPHVRVPWYRDQFTADPAVGGFSLAERVAYAFLMSAALKLTRLPRQKNEVYLYQAPVKDAWEVRPRTPPLRILDIFPASRQDAMKQALARSAPPAVADPPTATDWTKFTGWITDGRSLGGHKPPDATINGTPALLFEYRRAPVDQYPSAFWQPGEWTTETF
jgi:hypothetical protein